MTRASLLYLLDPVTMEIRVLGPLLLTCGDTSVAPTAPKPRSALALLLLRADQTVPVSDFVQDLWGDQPPPSVLTTLQTYILNLRKLLGRAMAIAVSQVADTVLLTRPGGYQFAGAPGHFDLDEYERLAAAGRQALAAGRNREAADLLALAQGLWRGPALADVRAGRLLEPEIRRLEESRLATVEQGIEARLRLGRHAEVLAELSALTARYPLHENLHAQFMVALHRSGRRHEALRVYQQVRATLRADLGLEPSRRLQTLQRAIICDDPGLEVVPRGDGLAQLLDRLTVR
jgi:SARP family transcriptional regulator, regulator of embCAB operon